MQFTEFQAAAAKKAPLPPLILLQGGESFLREQGVRALKLARPDLAGNTLRFPSSDLTWAALTGELHTGSFLGGSKLVVVADEGNWLHNNVPALKEYLQSPSPTSTLAVLVPSEKAAGIPEGKAVWVVDCRALRPGDLGRWVQQLVQAGGKTIERAAQERLATRGGPDLSALAGHVENLLSYAGQRASITTADVDALVVGETHHKEYELSLAAAKKQAKKALEIAHALIRDGEPAQKILWKLAWQYRKLVEAKKLLLAGRHRFEVTSLLQITFYPDEFLGLVDGHSLDELLEKHGEILATDLSLKTGGGQETLLLERLVLRLCRGTAARETQRVH